MQRFVTALFLLLLNCISFQSVLAATTVQFTLVRDYLIVVPIAVNGAEVCEFLLDTGANTTLVTPEFAQKLKLQATDRIALVTVAGTQAIPRAQLSQLSLGNETMTEVEVLVSELAAVRSVRPTISGVLGQNVLTNFNYLVDFPRRRIVLEDDTELEQKLCGAPVPIELHEGRVMVTVQNQWRLVLDSGIAMLSFFDAAGRMKDLEFTDTKLRPMNATSDLGSRTVWHGQLRSFVIGQETFRALPVALFETSAKAEGRVEEGLLPLRLFETIYVNHHQQYLLLNPPRVHP
jgi:predicted aspartyl protease